MPEGFEFRVMSPSCRRLRMAHGQSPSSRRSSSAQQSTGKVILFERRRLRRRWTPLQRPTWSFQIPTRSASWAWAPHPQRDRRGRLLSHFPGAIWSVRGDGRQNGAISTSDETITLRQAHKAWHARGAFQYRGHAHEGVGKSDPPGCQHREDQGLGNSALHRRHRQ